MADIDNSPNIITEAGDYNLEKISIVSYRKSDELGAPYEMNIKPITTSIELTESIFSGFMVGSVTVFDSQDIRTVLPITGLDRLELAFSTPGMPGVNAVRESGHPFHIYKVDQVTRDSTNPRAQFYKIYFCSKEMYYNSLNRVSRAFTGPLEYGIESILREESFLNSKKIFNFEKTKTNTKYVIPNLKPLEAINLLASQALSGLYNNAGYMFYETCRGFNFRSLESMLALGGAVARPSKFSYGYQITNTGDRNVETDMRSVMTYTFDRPVNTMFNINEGMYASRLVNVDGFYKTIEENDFDYAASFGKYFHTEHESGAKSDIKSLLPLNKFENTNKDLSQFPLAKLMSATSTSKIHNDYEIINPKENMQIRLSQRVQMRNVNLGLKVYGNTLLNAGDIITFDMPVLRPVGEGERQQSNPYYAGRYLITSLKHTISQVDEKHIMDIECMKDAVRNPLPIETDNNSLIEREWTRDTIDIYEQDSQYLTGDLLGDLE